MNPPTSKQAIAKKMPEPSFLQGLGGAFPEYRAQLQSAGNAIGNGVQAVGSLAQGIKGKIAEKMAPKPQMTTPETAIPENPASPSPQIFNDPKAAQSFQLNNPGNYAQLAPVAPAPLTQQTFGQSTPFGPGTSDTNVRNYLVNSPNGSKSFASYNIPTSGFSGTNSLNDSERYIRLGETYPRSGPVLVQPGMPLYGDFTDKMARLGQPNASNPSGSLGWEGLNNFIPEYAAAQGKKKSQQLPIDQATLNQANMTYPKDTKDEDGTVHKKGDLMNPELKEWTDYVLSNQGSAEQINRYYDETYK